MATKEPEQIEVERARKHTTHSILSTAAITGGLANIAIGLALMGWLPIFHLGLLPVEHAYIASGMMIIALGGVSVYFQYQTDPDCLMEGLNENKQ